jgi:acyl dehydratase
MSLNLDAVGMTWDAGNTTWTSADTLLYAVALGAGADDPVDELEFTTENSTAAEQQVLPTFAAMLRGPVSGPSSGDFPLSKVLHAEQSVTLFGPLTPSGTATVSGRLAGIYDKDPNAFIVTESSIADAASGAPLAKVTTTIFVRGEGGFGGDSGPSSTWSRPDRDPDHVVEYKTRPNQALLYRLTGDRNPLHSDPSLAAGVGYPRPILHGMCTWGFSARALLHRVADSDPAAFGAFSARFSSPVQPRDTLTDAIWVNGETAAFQTLVGDRVVLDRGSFTRSPA